MDVKQGVSTCSLDGCVRPLEFMYRGRRFCSLHAAGYIRINPTEVKKVEVKP